jgi:cytosine/adenosine deaminase-related metal-dependent hydrolase
LLANGVTAAGIYSSSHPAAAEALLTELDGRGLRAVVGNGLDGSRRTVPGC